LGILSKSLLDVLGLDADTTDRSVLAKACEAAGVISQFMDKTAGNLPDASVVSKWLNDSARKHGILEWDADGFTGFGKLHVPASELADLWDKIQGRDYRLGIPLDDLRKDRSLSAAALRNFASGTVRPGALCVLDEDQWAGQWHWPLRLGVLPGGDGLALLSRLEDISMVRRGLATIDVVDDVGDTCDVLLVPDRLDTYVRRSIKSLKDIGIGAIAILTGSNRSLTEKIETLAKVRRVGAAGASILVDLPDIGAMAHWTDQLVRELSHNNTVDEALWDAGRSLQEELTTAPASAALGGAADAPLVVSTLDALKAAPLANAIRRMAEQAKEAPPHARVVVSPTVSETLGLSKEAMSGAEVAAALEEALTHDESFLREKRGATGAVALGKAIHDAATGEDERVPDIRLFAAKGDKVGPRVAPAEALVPDRAYVLEFAIRSQRIGIGFEGDPRPIKGVPKADCDLLVTLAAQGQADEVVIPQPVQILHLPKQQDSVPVNFLFTLKKVPASGELQLAVRVYYRLNLIDHIVLRSRVSDASVLDTSPAHQLIQKDVSDGYDVDFAGSYQPRQMNIHITPESDGYRLAIVIEDTSGRELVRMLANSPITGEDLTQELEKIRDLWLTSALDRFGNVLRAPKAVEDEVWQKLADAGRDLWLLLFRGEQGGALDAIRTFLEANPLPAGSVVQVILAANARSFVFPWALLHDGSTGGNGKHANFWGMQYVIEQKLESTTIAGELPLSRDPPALSVMLYKRVKETALQINLISEMRARSGEKIFGAGPVESADRLKKLLADSDAAVLYFFCHGYTPFPVEGWMDAFRRRLSQLAASDESFKSIEKAFSAPTFDQKEAWIELTKSTVTLRELERETINLRGRPMVILNMCHSAQILPKLTNSFVDFFLRKRARSVLGTECPVPPVFASAFAHELIPQLLSGIDIGQALLESRRSLAESHGNPLGLAYTLWGAAGAKYDPAAIQPDAANEFRSKWRKDIS